MITKAIVEEIISPYQVKVRIPLLDRAEATPLSTNSEDLNIATICCLPNCYINLQVGDIVFVGFEDNTYYKAVILGHLCRESTSNTYSDAAFSNLDVRSSVRLPSSTTIGSVTGDELSRLSGTTENIQQQLNSLKEQIDFIIEQLNGGKS